MKLKLYILSVFLLGLSTVATAQRPVHWIHGLGDEPDIWQRYAPLFPIQRQMDSNPVDYNTNNGVLQSTNNADGEIPNTNTNNYLIGHSMGGLVARQYEINRGAAQGRANAILTIGTPHEGAFVANNLLDGDAGDAINFAVGEMIAGPVLSGQTWLAGLLVGSAGLVGVFASIWANREIDDLTEDLFGIVNERLEDMENNIGLQSLQDLQVGSPYLTGLNNNNRPVAMANIVCEENDRPALRLANAAVAPPEEAPLHNYNDSDMIQTVNNIESAYRAKRVYHDVMKFTQPWLFVYHNNRANAWGRGEDYLDDRLDGEYNAIIGATRRENRIRTEWVEVCDDGCGMISPDGARVSGIQKVCYPEIDPTNCQWVQRTITYTVTISERSDGLVTSGSQHYDRVPVNRRYFAVGASHLEAGNHPQVTARITEVFDRIDELGIPTR